MRRGLAAAAAMLLAGLAMSGGAEAASTPIGAVESVRAEAFGTAPGGARGALAPDDPLVADQAIETAETGALHLRFVDDSDLWLDRKSSLVLDRLDFDPASNTGAYAVQLGAGLFRFVTGRLGEGSFEVWTPSAVISAEGGDFVVSVASSGATRVTAYDGRVKVRPRLGGNSVSLGPPTTAMVARATGPAMASPFVDPVGAPEASVADRPLPTIEAMKLDNVSTVVGGQGPGSGANGRR